MKGGKRVKLNEVFDFRSQSDCDQDVNNFDNQRICYFLHWPGVLVLFTSLKFCIAFGEV